MFVGCGFLINYCKIKNSIKFFKKVLYNCDGWWGFGLFVGKINVYGILVIWFYNLLLIKLFICFVSRLSGIKGIIKLFILNNDFLCVYVNIVIVVIIFSVLLWKDMLFWLILNK